MIPAHIIHAWQGIVPDSLKLGRPSETQWLEIERSHHVPVPVLVSFAADVLELVHRVDESDQTARGGGNLLRAAHQDAAAGEVEDGSSWRRALAQVADVAVQSFVAVGLPAAVSTCRTRTTPTSTPTSVCNGRRDPTGGIRR